MPDPHALEGAQQTAALAHRLLCGGISPSC